MGRSDLDLNRFFDWLDANKRPIQNGLYVTAAGGALAAALSLRTVSAQRSFQKVNH